MLVGALVRRTQEAGGFATVIRSGDPISGILIIDCLEKGQELGLFERMPDYESGGYRLVPCGPKPGAEPQERAAYLDRRMRTDPDLWIVELDIVGAERFAAETIGAG